MEQKQIQVLLKTTNALITDTHVVYKSGRHGHTYFNKDIIYPRTHITGELGKALASLFMDKTVEVVIAPAVGGVILSQWVAYHLTWLRDSEVLGVYAEKDEQSDGFVIKRGYDKLITRRRVLVVEDVLTTGGTVKKVVEAVRRCEGFVVGVGALCNRGNVSSFDIDVSTLRWLLTLDLPSWPPDECPLCRDSVPINVDVGHGRDFLQRRSL